MKVMLGRHGFGPTTSFVAVKFPQPVFTRDVGQGGATFHAEHFLVLD